MKEAAPLGGCWDLGFGCDVLASGTCSTGPEENSRYLASRGCYSAHGCGKAGERPSMSRGIRAAHHRRWAAYAMSLGFRGLGIRGLGFRVRVLG